MTEASATRPHLSFLQRLLGSPADAVAPAATPTARRPVSPRDRYEHRHGAALDAVLDFLVLADLSPRPEHYALAWFYTAEADAAGRQRIDAHLATHGRIAPAEAVALLDTLRSEIGTRELASLVAAAQGDIGAARTVADTASADAADYGRQIGDAIPGLIDDAGDAAAIITSLRELSEDMASRAKRAEAALKSRSAAMGRLKARLAECERLAMSDALTGLPNRRAFDSLLNEALMHNAGTQRPLTVGFCDIDHFKAVNDSHGHATGDRVLRHVADALARTGGARCHVARHGGEEFAVLFDGKDAETARDQLDKVRERLLSTRLVARDSNLPIGTITFSGGLAERQPGETASDLLSRADRALYDAKQLGRDQIRIARLCDPAADDG